MTAPLVTVTPSSSNRKSTAQHRPDGITLEEDLAAERTRLANMWDQLTTLQRHHKARLDETKLEKAEGTQQSRSERDIRADLHARELDRVRSAGGHQLCFGRLDDAADADAAVTYVGRLSIHDEENEVLLTDWRAPVAEAFYRATPLHAMGISRRRHFITDNSDNLLDVEDEVFGLEMFSARDAGIVLRGEGALLAALHSSRTAHMRDIVATIQKDQDEIVRLPLRQTVVVQGGPGTGKTAVALHRAAYLLYTHRDHLSRSGVLVVGPNPTFMNYVSRVLPSLGEAGAVLMPIGRLYPGVVAHHHDADAVARVKGDIAMLDVLGTAVFAHQRVPKSTVDVAHGAMIVHIEPDVFKKARRAARRSDLPHNDARDRFTARIRTAVKGQVERKLRLRQPDIDHELAAATVDAVMDHARLQRLIERVWPTLTAEMVLTRLYSDTSFRHRVCGGHLSELEAEQLRSNRDEASWTIEDVPLLDELEDLVGTPSPTRGAMRARRRTERVHAEERERSRADAAEVLAGIAGEGASEMNLGALDADALAGRYSQAAEAEEFESRARRDRTWQYGHLIVDEAQELSPMAWRVLQRRCSGSSATIVGDLDQGRIGEDSTWQERLRETRFKEHELVELTVNYRTPKEIMALATAVLLDGNPDARPPEAVRSAGVEPVITYVPGSDQLDAVAAACRSEFAAFPTDALAVIVPPDKVRATVETLAGVGESNGAGEPVVLAPREAKGLEYDSVIVCEPSQIASTDTAGAADLYVSLTRATKRLTILHSDPLPAALQTAADA